MPDIVQVPAASSVPSQSKTQSQTLTSRESRNSHNSRNSYEAQPIRICRADVDIAFSPQLPMILYFVLSRQCVMLRDVDLNGFSGIYIICGYTDMRYGIDSLAAIIEKRFSLPLFVLNTLFLFCGKRANHLPIERKSKCYKENEVSR